MSTDAQAVNNLDRGAWARRHNHALVALARQIWHADCTLATALALICETAADTLDVERVNIWKVDTAQSTLRCIHGYERSTGLHNAPGYDETLDCDSAYGAQLDEVRVIDTADVTRDGTVSASQAALGAYRQRHRICSLLDAPIRSEGELLGVICHEHIDTPRTWTPEDEAFAGSIGDYVAMAQEISRRRSAETQLRFLERHDPDTELPNRDHLLEVTQLALLPNHANDVGLAAIHLQLEAQPVTHSGAADIDSDTGVLLAVAEKLRANLGETVTLARVRDDGFALLPHRQLHETEALNLAEHCIELIQQSAADAGMHHAGVSVGIAFSRDLAAPSADALLRNAELASQRARRGGHNRCEVFDAEHHRGLLVRMRTEQALRDAFAEQRLLVYYQPEINLDDGHWHAAEALLRWRDEDGRIRVAGEFIEVAEASGLIVALGRWVLTEACRVASTWPQRDGVAPLLRVNVSARQFEQAGLVADVASALSTSGLPPSRLCLELTETALLRDPSAAAAILTRLRALGLGIALDDFGTGFSSLAYLKDLPIDALKLDQRFIAGLPDDRYDLAIVQAVATLARQTGLDVIAEGVETEKQAQALRDCGVVHAQGYLYARALPCDELVARFGGAA
ncbi:MAG: sensor domain-containing phosphodiesterase [Lysobacter sp.]|nr:sensor domain-containing phosphodiesterase [Lysobacter sp.]